jgi:tRNA (Thr-GGU) A37 N-methylase
MAKSEPAPSVTPEEVLGVFDARARTRPNRSAPEIADALSVS